jgi:STE24 endopeptidase
VVAGLAAGAFFLLPTAVPGDLELPPIDVDRVFGAELVGDARRYERFFYVDWLLAEIALLVTLWLYSRRGAALVRESAAGPIGTGMLLGMLGLGVAWLVGLPFRIAVHWWARRNDTSEVGYVDWLLEDWILLAAEFLAVSFALVVVMGLARRLGERWWLPGAAVFVGIAAVFTFAVPYLDFTSQPLRDASLRETASGFERELGLGHVPLRVEEVSEDTDVANAVAMGIGPSRRVVFWDTLLQEPFSTGEQEVVLAHELAHHSQRHLLEGLGWFTLFAVPSAWILMRATRRRGGMGEPEAVPLALFVVACIMVASAPAANAVSRRLEQEADWKALEVTSDPAAVRRLMTNLAETSFADPEPPEWTQVLFGTHPTFADRVALARAWAEHESP